MLGALGVLLIVSCDVGSIYSDSFGFSGGENVYATADGGGGGVGGSMARFTLVGDYLYTVSSGRIKLFDVSAAGSPAYLPTKDQELPSWDAETIFVMDTLLFIGSQSGMYVYNVTRPLYPQQIAYVSHIASCDPVVASGSYAYVTLNSSNFNCGRSSNLLNIYDISDLEAIKLVQSITGFTGPRGLGIDGNKLFVCDKGAGIRVYDVSDPVRPIWKSDLSAVPGISGIDPYDVIPLPVSPVSSSPSLLLLSASDGIYQFSYVPDSYDLTLLSKLPIKTVAP
jgi:hypothetical protein